MNTLIAFQWLAELYTEVITHLDAGLAVILNSSQFVVKVMQLIIGLLLRYSAMGPIEAPSLVAYSQFIKAYRVA